MIKNNIDNKVKSVLSEEFGINADKITNAYRFFEELGADSLDMLEVAYLIEKEFDIKVDDSYIDTFNCVQDLIDYVENKLKNKR